MYEYFEEMENGSFLEHHGILGQKWGIRRFQNYDGTLKNAGKKRRSEDRVKKRAERKAARAEKKEAKAQAKAEKKEAKEEEARKNLRSDIDKAIANVDFKKISELKGQMTDDDLLKLSKRAQALGKTAENLDKYKKGLPPSTFDKAIKGLGAVKTGADAVVNAHKAFTSLREEFGLDTKSILNSVDDSGSDGGSKSNEPDIVDRALKLAGKITKDAANKANEKYQEHKFQKDLQEARDRKKDSDTLNWLENLNGGKKDTPLPKANFDSGFKLKDGDYDTATGKSVGKFIDKLGSVGDVTNKERSYNKGAYSQQQLRDSVSGHGKIDRGFRLGDGDYSIFSSATRDTKVSDLPKPRNIKLPKGSGSKPISEVLKDLDDLTSDLSDNNRRRLGL